ILAPRQAARFRKIGDKKWKDTKDASFDVSMPYICKLPSGKQINLFFYDGAIAQDIAFGDLLRSGENFAGRLLGSVGHLQATHALGDMGKDGETFGHYYCLGEMGLVYCFHQNEEKEFAKLTIYGEYLELYPPTHEVEIIENSSWSCIHGVSRWKEDCGC